MMLWNQDKVDYSWILVDRDDCFFRVSPIYAANGDQFWTFAWTESRGLRISHRLFTSCETAKQAVEAIANLE